MATLIFIDKDNEEPGSRLASKDGLKLASGVKASDGKLQISAPQVGKVFNAPVLPKASRKALGTVNRVTEKPVKINRPLKQKQPTLTVKKTIEKAPKTQQVSVPASDDAYPEIEKFFPFNPLDFESFDLPEEHQIAHLPLSGVPLMILNEESGLEKLLHLDPPSPLKTPFLPWESNPLLSPSSVLSNLDVELPPVCYDEDI
ncbi:securin [Cricetulus griseus]|uniref:Securin n=1 Tax=Cricetulus griseus TaxID=10029 RepID=G3HDY0_CRIGR|nr:securin [Cricetulus griseus]XP_027281043.1 securin [Cricetulus griseus]XP_027281044.1 securin [Cricetulus griseus]EGW03061.1 Securin [Cricetulus griseus]ERE69063.1 securin-like protein [Cricetulus griseus]